jgi:hypothetical protein
MFVGAAAYEAPGGRITRGLLSGDEDGLLDDAALVRRLALDISKRRPPSCVLRGNGPRRSSPLSPNTCACDRSRPRCRSTSPPRSSASKRAAGNSRDGEADWTDEFRGRSGAVGGTPRQNRREYLSGTPADRLIETQAGALDLDWVKLPLAKGFVALSARTPIAKQHLSPGALLRPEAAAYDRGSWGV